MHDPANATKAKVVRKQTHLLAQDVVMRRKTTISEIIKPARIFNLIHFIRATSAYICTSNVIRICTLTAGGLYEAILRAIYAEHIT